MIANFGYKDGSGDFFISIDTDKCNGCGDCVPVCPADVLEVRDNEFDPLAEDKMAAVTEAQRKKIKYACSACKSETNATLPCIEACKLDAIVHSW
jgi:Fe-S-cluster-containing hydrogenase component 2